MLVRAGWFDASSRCACARAELRSTRVITAGYAFVQNIRRGRYELAVDADPRHRLPAAFTELTLAI